MVVAVVMLQIQQHPT